MVISDVDDLILNSLSFELQSFIICMCVIPGGRVTCLFYYHYYGVDAMGGGLEWIN